jgi:RNA polymerase sigma factor (sigma-70 family)
MDESTERSLDAERRERERTLVAQAARGDRDAARRLWERNAGWVAAVLLAHKPRDADLDDLVQDVAMTFLRRIGELRDDGAFGPWLRTVALNVARAAGRTSTRRGGILSRLRPSQRPAEPADEIHSLREDAAKVLRAARALPDPYAEPLLLRGVQGMSYERIGEILDLPRTTVETRIARARRMLREALARPGEAACLPEGTLA